MLKVFFFLKSLLDLPGLNASERSTIKANASRIKTNTNDEENNTAVPFVAEKDYLFTGNPIKYSVLFILRQALDNSRFLIDVNAVQGRLSETLYTIKVHNRTVLFQHNNSIIGLFILANVSSWQKLLVNFNHREITVTQECAEFNYISLPSTSNLEEWETITVTVQTENSRDNIEVCRCLAHSLKNSIILTFDLCTEGIGVPVTYWADFKWSADRFPVLFNSLLLSLSDVTAMQCL